MDEHISTLSIQIQMTNFGSSFTQIAIQLGKQLMDRGTFYAINEDA